ncbi:MAG: hypothetical protein H6862_05500 [Rhodospirillales bacterium]|nr:hypothetical protein [Rhodospirillales bacterium]
MATDPLRNAWNTWQYKFPLARLKVPRDNRNFIEPQEYRSSDKGNIQCPGDGCDAPLIFVSGYRKQGCREIPDTFRAEKKDNHVKGCNHEESAAQHSGHKDFNPSIGLRFHLNKKILKGWEVSPEQIRKFEKEGLLEIDPLYYQREIVNIHAVRDFFHPLDFQSLERLGNSKVRYQNTLPTLSDFLVAGPKRLSGVFNALSTNRWKQDGQPRLFYLNPEKWGRTPLSNGTFPLICHPYQIETPGNRIVTLQPRITFGPKDIGPAFLPQDHVDLDCPVLLLAVPKLFPQGENPATTKQWILFLDIENPDFIQNKRLDFSERKKTLSPVDISATL